MNNERILALADAIEKGDPIKFNIRSFGDNLDHPCETTGCIAGFAILLFEGREEFERAAITNNWFAHAAYTLQLSEDTAKELFWPPFWDTRKYSPQEAARTLRHVAKTGVVLWDLR